MKELARHIEVLLLDNDCVIVPGLGGFVTHHIPARRVENEHKFLPPYRTLGFSPKMVLNDGLLVQSYMQAYDTTYPSALKLVEAKVEELKQLLQSDGKFQLHGIGTLFQNIKGDYTFTPLEAGALSPDLYGYGAFEMLTLQELEAQQEPKPAILQPAAVADTEVQDDKAVVIRMNRRWITGSVAAACIALLIGMALMFPSPGGDRKMAGFKPLMEWFNHINKQETVAKVEVKAEKPAPKKTTVKKATPKAEVAAPQEKVETPVAVPAPKDYYTIVLASSIPMKNAEAYAKQMADKGFPEGRVLSNNNLNRVVYAQFESENQAITRLRKLRQEDMAFAEAWVLRVK